jgi:MFS family permease
VSRPRATLTRRDGSDDIVERRSVAVLGLLCSAQFLVVLDVTVVAIALPDVRRALGFSAEGLQWVLTAYTLTFGGLLVTAGRAADLAGRRRLFRVGVALFGAASLGCGLAPSAAALVALRAVQGVGAAIVAPAALALLTAAFDGAAERRRAVAWWTAAAAGGGASGWVLGGVLVESLGWRAVFLVNLPICAVVVALAPRVLAESRLAVARRLDLPGAALVTAGLTLLVHGFTRAEAAGFDDRWAAASLAAALIALAAFAVVERRAADPILPPSALRLPAFAAATGAALALTATTTPPMFLSILYQQELLERSALATGLSCAPFNLAVIGGSVLAPRFRWTPGGLMAGGLCAIASGALLLTGLSSDGGSADRLLPAFLIMGAGLGCAAVASTASGTAALSKTEQGIASGVLNAAAQVGTALGLAVLVSLAAAMTSALGPGRDALVAGYRWGFAGSAALALAAAAAALAVSRRATGSSPRCRRPLTRQHR